MRGNQEEEEAAPLRNVVSLDKFRRRTRAGKAYNKAAISFRENASGGIDYKIDAISAINALTMLEALIYVSDQLLKIYRGS